MNIWSTDDSSWITNCPRCDGRGCRRCNDAGYFCVDGEFGMINESIENENAFVHSLEVMVLDAIKVDWAHLASDPELIAARVAERLAPGLMKRREDEIQGQAWSVR